MKRRHPPPADAPTYRCMCGCNEVIPWKPSHRSRPPRYILRHYLRDGTSLRIVKLREAKLRARVAPPADWIPTTGLCECGCGKPTRIAKYSRPERGEYIGYPRHWFHGHYQRAALSKRGPEHPHWKGGRCAVKGGYVLVYHPEHPTANRDGYMLEHRYIYETTRNVQLPRTIQVHHVNGIKSDNRPDNLIATSRPAHTLVHIRAGLLLALPVDTRLFAAAVAHAQTHGEWPDLEALTQQVYGAHD